ncbi:MAG: endolytic transglycosylase MltG [Bacteroidales bacterium]
MNKPTKKKTKKNKRIPFWIKVVLSVLLIIILAGGYAGYRLYNAIYEPNIFLGERTTTHIFIPTGSDFAQVKNILYENGMIINSNSFEWLAEKKNYKNHIYPGRYLIHEDMGNNDLINLLRSGQQDPVLLTFNNIRTKEELAGRIASQIEADSLSIIQLLNDENFLQNYELTRETSKIVFIPNSYEFFWNTSAQQLFDRMWKEFENFWNEDRLQKAENLNMTPAEVATLASVVQKETSKPDEYSKVAGVYVNRLKRNMPLQADPTVIYALGDFSIRRVLNRHLATDSPYNTYMYAGLPPGPIALPEPRVIDGVLTAEEHNYLYFSAKADFSGYHAFATNYRQHLINARKYQQELNRRKIMR